MQRPALVRRENKKLEAPVGEETMAASSAAPAARVQLSSPASMACASHYLNVQVSEGP